MVLLCQMTIRVKKGSGEGCGMMKSKQGIFPFMIVIIGIVLPIFSLHVYAKTGLAEEGVYSIDHFPEDGFLKLDGEWEFYWKELYTPEDFGQNKIQSLPKLLEIPHGSNGYRVDGDIRNTGYATYRLMIQFPEEEVGTIKALQMPSVASAYNLWINGEVKASNGRVGTSKNAMEPQHLQKIVLFQVHSSSMELVIQNSNFNQRKAGIFDSVLIGEPEVFFHNRERAFLLRSIVIGSLFIIGLYHVSLFVFRRKEPSLIFFGCLCLIIAMRSILLEDGIAAHLLPFLSWEVASKLEYLGSILGILLVSLFTYTLYPQDMSRGIRNIIIFVTSMYSLFVLVTPVMTSTKAMVIMQAMIILIFLYLLFIHVTVFIRKRESSFLNAAAIFIIFATTVNDVLMYNDLIDSIELSSVGLVFYLFTQSIIISKKYSLSFVRNERLTKELSTLNASLEQKVQKRTEELKDLNGQLQAVNEKLGEEYQSRSKWISNISHEIGAPLTAIQAYTKGMVDGVIESEPKYIRLIYEKSMYLSRILNDLRAIMDLENKQMKFDMKRVDIRKYSELLYERNRLDIEKQGITFEYIDLLPKEIKEKYVLMDVLRIEQVVTNLLTNAQRFVGENAKIVLELLQENENEIQICVKDNGRGIREEELHLVFKRFYSKNHGNQHNGSGLGLAISKEIIEYHNGIITVNSQFGEWTCFSFTLPVLKE